MSQTDSEVAAGVLDAMYQACGRDPLAAIRDFTKKLPDLTASAFSLRTAPERYTRCAESALLWRPTPIPDLLWRPI